MFRGIHASHIISKSKAEKWLQFQNKVNELRPCTFSIINYISFSVFQNGTYPTSLPLANGFPYATRFLSMHHQQTKEKSTSRWNGHFSLYITQHQSSSPTAPELKQSGNVRINSSNSNNFSERIRSITISNVVSFKFNAI